MRYYCKHINKIKLFYSHFIHYFFKLFDKIFTLDIATEKFDFIRTVFFVSMIYGIFIKF